MHVAATAMSFVAPVGPEELGPGLAGGILAKEAKSAAGASITKAVGQTFEEGSFSIIDWTGYPVGMPKPTGPVRVLTGQEYAAARALANETNAAIRAANQLEGSGLHIHEVKPIKFGGSPTDLTNKILIPAAEHTGPRGVHQQFWTPLLRWVMGGSGFTG
jgi:filamentous hemagglutinin